MKLALKRILPVLAALVLLVMLALNTSAAVSAADSGAVDAAVSASDDSLTDAESLPDGVVQEDDMIIDLRLTTTLIAIICSVLTICIGFVVVMLAKRNHK